MRKTLLAVLILLAPGLLAQEPPPAQNTAEHAAAAAARQQATPAPQLGHPLDPADVDTLTGKDKRPSARGYGFDVPSYGWANSGTYLVSPPQFGPSQFAAVSTATRPPFVPLVFGRAGSRSFFLIGDTTSFVPPLFLFTRGRRSGSLVPFAPMRPRFSAPHR